MSGAEGVEGAPSGVLPVDGNESDEESTAEKIMTLQRECADLYFAAMHAVNHTTKREILLSIADNAGSATYEEVTEYVSATERTMRKHITNLEDAELVQRINSRSHAVTFPSSNVRILVSHALACHFQRGF